MAGRYKLGPQGTYFDPNDSGPDQASPDQVSAYQQQQGGIAPAPPSSGGYTPPTGGIGGWPENTPPAPSMPTIDNPDAPIRQPGYQFDPSQMVTPTGPEWQPPDPNSDVGKFLAGRFNPSQASPKTPLWGDYIGAPSSPSPTTGINGTGGAQQVPTAATQSPWQQTATPAGFDQTKWNDPTKSDPKYDVGHMVASGMTNEQIQQYLSQHDPGYNVTGKDIITDPQGNQFDFRFDQEGANKPMWEGVGGPGFQSGAAGTGGAGAAAGAGGAGGAAGAAPQNSQFSDQVRQLLLQQLGSVTGPVTANDPAIKAEMDAQTAGADRVRRDQRASDAERAAFQGLLNGGQSSGSFDQSVNNGFSQEQQQLAGVRADLFTREIQSRRQYAQGLLNQAIQSGDAESARQLQAYLAQLDNAYRYAALNQNQSQFNDQFGLNASQVLYNRDKDLASYGAGY